VNQDAKEPHKFWITSASKIHSLTGIKKREAKDSKINLGKDEELKVGTVSSKEILAKRQFQTQSQMLETEV
jgi:hypothetical protein